MSLILNNFKILALEERLPISESTKPLLAKHIPSGKLLT